MWLYDCLGLSIVANIQQHQYVTEVGTTAGLIVLVQPQNMMPFPEDRGKLVSPGYQTEIALTQVRPPGLSLLLVFINEACSASAYQFLTILDNSISYRFEVIANYCLNFGHSAFLSPLWGWS